MRSDYSSVAPAILPARLMIDRNIALLVIINHVLGSEVQQQFYLVIVAE